MKANELDYWCLRLLKRLGVAGDYIEKGTAEYISVQQLMTEFILETGISIKAKTDAHLVKQFFQVLVRKRKQGNLKKVFREVLGVEVSPTDISIANKILQWLEDDYNEEPSDPNKKDLVGARGVHPRLRRNI